MTDIKIIEVGPLTVKTDLKTFRTFTGPESVVERQFWPKFGSASDRTLNTTHIANEVNIEYSNSVIKEKKWVSPAFYIKQAELLKWNRSEVEDIQKSEAPDELFYKIFTNKSLTMCAMVDSKYEGQLRAIDAPTDCKPLPGQATVPVLDLKISKGFRSRLNVKLAEVKDKAKALEEEAEKSKEPGAQAVKQVGITARIKKLKEDKEITEQNSTIFVHNVPIEFDEQDIRESLKGDFTITRVNIVKKAATPMDTVKTSIGSAFIVCANVEDAERCLKVLNGHRWGNLIASASFSRPIVN